MALAVCVRPVSGLVPVGSGRLQPGEGLPRSRHHLAWGRCEPKASSASGLHSQPGSGEPLWLSALLLHSGYLDVKGSQAGQEVMVDWDPPLP